MPAFRGATNEEHIKRGYYSIRALNPSGMVPVGPLDPFGVDKAGESSLATSTRRSRSARRHA